MYKLTDKFTNQTSEIKFRDWYLITKLDSNPADQTTSAVRTVPQASTTIRLIDIGQSTSQVSRAVSESGSHISPGVHGVFATYLHATV
jgi:hypothetical protein